MERDPPLPPSAIPTGITAPRRTQPPLTPFNRPEAGISYFKLFLAIYFAILLGGLSVLAVMRHHPSFDRPSACLNEGAGTTAPASETLP